jgi:UDP-N-acetylmuramate--alanine ligase
MNNGMLAAREFSTGQFVFPDSFSGKHVHMVGIKGTGMTALAEILVRKNVRVTGSDTKEKFYTDTILEKLGIGVIEAFSASNISDDTVLVIHSAAYAADTNQDLARARESGIKTLTYPEALGLLSARSVSIAVSGVHGKTTTTAMAGTVVKHIGVSATTIAGSEVFSFGNSSTYSNGDKYLIAETCEYRRNFLSFHPSIIVITSVELDHPDYFKDLEDVLNAFVEFGRLLPKGGTLIYCADDKGAKEVSERLSKEREDIVLIPYGTSADGDFQLKGICSGKENVRFVLKGFADDFALKVPGIHSIYDASAAIAIACSILKAEKGSVPLPEIDKIRAGLLEFRGSRRRTEIIGEANGILFIDDYAHHPTAVLTTLKGIREFYPDRRIVLDFMSHTYSRTAALLEDFAKCFSPAHTVILHKIYASARESADHAVSGKELFDEVAKHHNHAYYYEEVMDAFDFAVEYLAPGDIFLTMGAGDNWKIGKRLYEYMKAADS